MQSADIPLKKFANVMNGGKGGGFWKLFSLLGREGNIKIPSTTAIFNTSSATDCASKKLGLCAACKAGVKCYALKAEYSYHPLVLPYRRRQETFWKGITAQDFVSQFLLINAFRVKPFNALRFSEAGDFANQKSLDKAEKIATLLSRFGIRCYTYSSRSDLDFSKCKNLIVSGSGFIKTGVSNIFKIIKDKKDRPKGWSICKGNCRICNLCQIRGKRIVTLAH